MKKIFLTLFILASAAIAANADNVSKEDAIRYAQQFFGNISSSELSVDGTGSNASVPEYYIINRKSGGFVLIAGDDAVDPVLGYSLKGHFRTDNMPDNLSHWLTSLEKDVLQVRNMGIASAKTTSPKIKRVSISTKAGSANLIETAEWDQTAPYNNLCTLSSGKNALSGCVATAMAIVLRHNEYPEHGTGELKGYTTTTSKYRIEGYSIDDHYYKWDMMPKNSSEVQAASEDEQYQIAQLIHDCGVMVGMDYGLNGSGAHTPRAVTELATHMGYSAAAQVYPKAIYNASEWITLLKSEIDQNRPLVYTGQDDNYGGHAFVVDGYDEDDYIHVNWGWSGECNGYFNLELSVSGYRFSESQSAIIGLVPDPEGTGVGTSNLILTGSGLQVTSGKLEKGSSFAVSADYFTNYGTATFNGSIVPVLVDKNNNIKERLCTPTVIEVKGNTGNGYYSATANFSGCQITCDIAFADKLTIARKNPTSGEYEPIPYDIEGGTVGSISTVPSFIRTESSYNAGDVFEFEFFSNGDAYKSLTWYFDGEVTDKPNATLTSGTHEVKLVIEKSNGNETIISEIKVN